MTNIAHLDTSVLDTAAKFIRTMKKAGADFTDPMQSVAKRRNLVEYLELGCPRVDGDGCLDTSLTPYDLAQLLLKNAFITPEEVMEARGLIYTKKRLEDLYRHFPSFHEVAWCVNNGAMLVPAPPEEMSLLDIRDLRPELFNNKGRGWYNDYPFATEEAVRSGYTGWLGIRKSIVPSSTKTRLRQQVSLVLERGGYVPNAATLVWGLTTYAEVRGVYSLEHNRSARTFSTTDLWRYVEVERFDEETGLVLTHHWGLKNQYIGVAQAFAF